MKKCPYCAEEIQDEAVRCKHCGQAVVDEHWRGFCDSYRALSPKQRKVEWVKLDSSQQEVFRAAWAALGYDRQLVSPRPNAAVPLLGIGCTVLVGLLVLGGLFTGRESTRRVRTVSRTRPSPAGPLPSFQLVGRQGVFRFVVMSEASATDRGAFQRVARTVCSGLDACAVKFWLHAEDAASGLPMTMHQVNTIHAAYNVNQNTGLDGFTCHPFGSPGERCAIEQ